ncbi:MAG: hypothetical protein A3F94_02400 [Candidatus Spechtbacteria bacterium RIFCSPLOWO2_12_FULL_38_22]|uniref:Uncharacterized protein n=1 Tax=Candidatus Spechtbacteria bacterium RIFCSPLOWO2_12_FULL_38_22 TaxID=1802165 RepID=A0A1G2HJI9_9BACT|nr:MAG: hypothetical protein A2728_03280 [Candidatus Spechtbacteria bacterium RIFCSPHIGHO2_01_FULL_38_11]OGZ59374.1 MAG: hypothetical protein A3A00_00480 [Candidatus Spechtbacteria bacterium RIFCSPLOWO2_01_FULL_38_20]OGZ59894.1 MAG: hypothetical protein A3E58_00535 [Candidatus Spechtbacteria bacterium RIFCSPHIGHO2_12_FULL_38_30]OGZ62058.1 MAG: hypothetical protein A3F94_02400 [Candidatus Spechtbacteria bacterium RIFCSPLOWO2_12_FULL_38_22]
MLVGQDLPQELSSDTDVSITVRSGNIRWDPYFFCDKIRTENGLSCGHDLARGITIKELLTSDGPYGQWKQYSNQEPRSQVSGVIRIIPT